MQSILLSFAAAGAVVLGAAVAFPASAAPASVLRASLGHAMCRHHHVAERCWLAGLQVSTACSATKRFWRHPHLSNVGAVPGLRTHSSSDLAVVEPFVSEADAADAFAKSDEYRMTCRAIALLHGRQRDVIALHCLAGYEIAEVAEMLGIAEETVRVHLSCGRRRLRVIVPEGRWHDDQG